MSEADSVIAEIRGLFSRRGGDQYGEGVTQREHALQAAAAAEGDGAPDAQIAAALLHDIGHLMHDLPDDIADRGIDTKHESLASAWLSQHFGPEVSEPVRLHVAAKRYLCRTEPDYWSRLSAASKQSLALQGHSEKGMHEKFGAMLDAFDYGAPPHGGIAIGIDRWAALLTNQENIREVMAFPKTQSGSDLMLAAPSAADPDQLAELHLRFEPPKSP